MKRSVSETKQKSPSLKQRRAITTGALGFWRKLDKIKLSRKDVFAETYDDEQRQVTTDSVSLPSSTSSYEMLEEDLDDGFEIIDHEVSDAKVWSDKVNDMIKMKFGERIRILVTRIDQRLKDFREVSSRRLAAFSVGRPVRTIDKDETDS